MSKRKKQTNTSEEEIRYEICKDFQRSDEEEEFTFSRREVQGGITSSYYISCRLSFQKYLLGSFVIKQHWSSVACRETFHVSDSKSGDVKVTSLVREFRWTKIHNPIVIPLAALCTDAMMESTLRISASRFFRIFLAKRGGGVFVRRILGWSWMLRKRQRRQASSISRLFQRGMI